MNHMTEQAASYLAAQAGRRDEARMKRMRNYWEPQVLAELTSAVDDCLDKVRQALAQRPGDASGPLSTAARMSLSAAFHAVALRQARSTRTLLGQMVAAEAAEYFDAVSINGLAGGNSPADTVVLTRGGREMERSALKSCAEFTRRVMAALEHLGQGEQGEKKAAWYLKRAAMWWRGRLGIAARTAVYKAASRARDQAMETLH